MPGALTGASVFTLTPVDQAVLDALPLPDGAGGFGSGVEVNTGGAVLKEEGDLSFPIPPAAPADAHHVIVRRVVEEGLDTYQVIDTAAVVDGKVKTESPPFYGFLVSGMYLNLWVPPTPAGKNPMGAITGIAREIDSSAVDPQERLLAGVQVRVDETLHPGSFTATTDGDGRFVLFDRFFGAVGPTLNLVARDTSTPPREVRAVAFEDQRILSRFLTLTRFSRAGDVVFNFPLTPDPPPPSEVTISLFRKNGEARVAITNGFAAVGHELIIKVQFTQPPENVSISVNEQNVPASRKEDERVNGETLFIFEGTFTPQEPRSYTIVAGGRDAFLNLLEARKSFLAAQGGAGNEERLEGPPSIISDSAVPRNGDTGVPVTQVMSVQFTEPVTNVFSGTVTFEELGETPTPIGLDILGTKVGGAVAPVTFTDEVVALTLTPQRGLKFATKYRLTFSTLIVDTDLSPTGEPDPKPLREETSTIEFETFRPTKLGEATLDATLVAMTTLDNYAFVALQSKTADGSIGNLELFDLSDPTQPTKVGDDSLFIGSMVRDVDVEKEAAGGSDVLGVLSFNPRSGNSGLTLFDVSLRESPFPYVGFVTTVVPGEGSDFQVDLHEGFAYVAIGSGLKIVNLEEARELFRAKLQDKTTPPIGTGSIPFDVSRGLFTRGVGFGQQAVENHLQIPDTSGNLRVSTIQVAGVGTERVGYAGSLSDIDQVGRFTTLNLANTPAASIFSTVALKTLPDPEGNTVHMSFPSDIALTDIDADKYAVVVGGPMVRDGRGTLAILKVTAPDTPELLTVIELKGGWGTNLAIDDDGVTVFVSTADRRDGDTTISGGVEIYNLSDPATPLFAGKVAELGGGSGGLAISERILVRAGSELGVQTTTLGPAVPLLTVVPTYALVVNDKSVENLKLKYRVVPDASKVTSARIEIKDEEGQVLLNAPVAIADQGEFTLPFGQQMRPTPRRLRLRVRNPNGEMSDWVSGVGGVALRAPEIVALSPMSFVAAGVEQEVTVQGRYFLPTTVGRIRSGDGTAVDLETTYESPRELKMTLPVQYVNAARELQLSAATGTLTSSDFPLSVWRSGTPEPPVLLEIEPSQVDAGGPSFFLTVRGSGFLEEDSVVASLTEGILPTEFISESELRVYVPDTRLVAPRSIGLVVDSLEFPGRASNGVVLEVVSSSGAGTVPIRPVALATTPENVPLVNPTGGNSEVEILGEGFESGAEVLADIDGKPAVPLQTQWISEGKVRATLTEAHWAERWLTVAFITTASPQTASVRVVPKLQPGVSVSSAQVLSITSALPGIFDLDALDPADGKPKDAKKFWTLQEGGFHILVNDPSLLSKATERGEDKPEKLAEVKLTSRDGPTQDSQQVDIIEKLKMERRQTLDVSAYLSGKLEEGVEVTKGNKQDVQRQVFIVTDEKDDEDFSPDDGRPEDTTIKTSVAKSQGTGKIGGSIWASYRNAGWDSPEVLHAGPVEVCPASQKRFMTVHLFNLSTVQEAVVSGWMDRVREIWAQACVEVDWALKAVVDINGNPIDTTSYRRLPDVAYRVATSADLRQDEIRALTALDLAILNGGGIRKRELSPEQARLIALTRGSIPTDEIIMYLVNELEGSTEVGGLSGLKQDVGGRGLTDLGIFRAVNESDQSAGLAALRLGNLRAANLTAGEMAELGVVFLQATQTSLRHSNKVIPPPTGKIVAHELGHLLLGPIHREGERVNIMLNGREDAGNLLQKRLNAGQVSDARRSRFVKQR